MYLLYKFESYIMRLRNCNSKSNTDLLHIWLNLPSSFSQLMPQYPEVDLILTITILDELSFSLDLI
jgi:hypothetical protein